MRVSGVDGCRAGWLCVEDCEGRLTGRIFKSFPELLTALPSASVIAIDIPIGLPEQGKRDCDVSARFHLGRLRASSVFPTSVLGILHEEKYSVANLKHRDIDGRGLSRQAFAILPKIREVNEQLLPKRSLHGFAGRSHLTTGSASHSVVLAADFRFCRMCHFSPKPSLA